jgi:hypothetical protein
VGNQVVVTAMSPRESANALVGRKRPKLSEVFGRAAIDVSHGRS